MKTPLPATSPTGCQDQPLLFQDLGARHGVADFSGGTLSTDGGALLLWEADHRLGLSRSLAACFDDQRAARFVDHQLHQLLAQRLAGQALGYEDLNDHSQLRRDPLLAVVCDKADPLGQDRCAAHHLGATAHQASTTAPTAWCPR